MFFELWDFILATIFFNDDAKIGERLHRRFVEKKKYISEGKWNEICSKTKFAIGSYKLNYAINIGLLLHGNIGVAIYLFVCLFTSLSLYIILYYVMRMYLNAELINVLINALYPVLAGYFVYRSFYLLKEAYKQFPLAIFLAYLALSFLLICLLELNVAMVLILSLFLFLCFTRGGRHDE